jgi:hypothetical protein
MCNSSQSQRLVVMATVMIGLLVVGLQARQRPSEGPLTAQTEPLSPSVLATIATRNQNVELVVLWRGAAGWFLGGSGRSANYSGGNATFTAALHYGGIDLSLSYEPARRTARVQGTAVSLPEGANVILVDAVDRGAVPTIAGVVKVDSHFEGNPTLASLLGGSPEIVSFLRCDAGTPDENTNRRIASLICDDLKR